MVVVQLDEDDLDEEDLAILAEVKKKGYYHGRPKSEACPPPEKVIEAGSAGITSGKVDRREFDAFQKKWDCFDNDEYIKQVQGTIGTNSPASLAPTLLSGAQSAVSAVPAGREAADLRKAAPDLATQQVAASFSVLLLGDGGVGKTSLLERLLTGSFSGLWCPTQSFGERNLQFWTNCGLISFRVFDANGSSWESGVGYPLVCPKVQAAIYMFDLTSAESHSNMPTWHAYVCSSNGLIPGVLVGNKADSMEQCLPASMVIARRPRYVPYYEMSVSDCGNIHLPFLWLARKLTNQPLLQFVGPRAESPTLPSQIGQTSRKLQEKKLIEACTTPVF